MNQTISVHKGVIEPKHDDEEIILPNIEPSYYNLYGLQFAVLIYVKICTLYFIGNLCKF